MTEAGRTIGTLFADPAVRQCLLEVKDQDEFMVGILRKLIFDDLKCSGYES